MKITAKETTLIAKLTLILGLASFAAPAQAADLLTGEKTGAYFNDFCPAIKSAVKDKNLLVNCRTTNGSLQNLDTVLEHPTQFGLAQYDLFSLKYSHQSNQLLYTPVRDDLGKECLFLVTKNKKMTNFGDIIASAPYMNFILPPEKSGHAGTFKYLQNIDKKGLGQARNVTHVESTEAAITKALASDDNVTLFVQFPNPDNKHFKLVNENGGHFIPVISKEILSQVTRGNKVYSAEETAVANPNWTKSGTKLVTACTPIVMFTGKSMRVTDNAVKDEHRRAIAILQEIPADKLRPQKGWLSKLWTSTKAVSAKSTETLVETTEQAKKVSSPYLSKAKEVTKDAIEAAKPTYEKAKEGAKTMLEKAKELGEKAIDEAGKTIEKNTQP